MIKNILMKGAPFSDKGINIELDKKNLIYGINGTGKTSISEYLRNPNDKRFERCDFNFSNNTSKPEIKPLVYNHHYINAVFREKHELDGVFTVGSKNNEIESEIEKLESQEKIEGRHLQEIKTSKDTELDKLRSSSTAIFENSKLLHQSNLRRFMDGFLKKDTLLKTLENLDESKLNEDQHITQESLESLAKSVSGEAETIKEIDGISININDICDKPIWEESIISSKNGYLTELIDKLDNEQWIREGTKYLKEDSDHCPFCNSVISSENKQSLYNLINGIYSSRVEELKNLKSQFEVVKSNINKLSNKLRDVSTKYPTPKEISDILSSLEKGLRNNIKIAQEKIDKPSITGLDFFRISEEKIKEIETFIAEANKIIQTHNEAVGDKKKSEGILTEKIKYFLLQQNLGGVDICRYRFI